MVGRVLAGRYELVRFIGRGGMGDVWEGRDRTIERRVAVKLLPHRHGDATGAELFLREARTAGTLNHPGVVTVHDLGQDTDGTLFLVMEFLDGRDLATVLQEYGPPPVATAIGWAAQAAAALARAHDAGIVHRDLKPANLMLTTSGHIKILDFGIARFMEATHRSGKVMGTLAYMPPERFDEQPGDPRSDLYSLGCVLNELLTGRVPFDTTGPVSMMKAHLRTPPTPPGEHRRSIPTEIDDLVLTLLAKDPAQRPATAHEVHDRLNATVTRAATTARRPPPPPPSERDAVTPTVRSGGATTITNSRWFRTKTAAETGATLLSLAFAVLGGLYAVTGNADQIITDVPLSDTTGGKILAVAVVGFLAGGFFGGLIGSLGTPHSITVDGEKIVVNRNNVPQVVRWDALEGIAVEETGDKAALVARFRSSREPTAKWRTTHGAELRADGRHVIYGPTKGDSVEVDPTRLRAALKRYAGELYDDPDDVPDP